MDQLPPHNPVKSANPSLSHPGVLLATWFGAGYLPKAPGTWGSLCALPLAWMMVQVYGPWLLFAVAVAVFFTGIWAANAYMRESGTHDPGPVVIDEVVGQWLTVVLLPAEPICYVAGFLLFRVFDIFKPWPVSWADRRIEGGMGVMLDDVVAAAYAGSIVYVLYRMEVF